MKRMVLPDLIKYWGTDLKSLESLVLELTLMSVQWTDIPEFPACIRVSIQWENLECMISRWQASLENARKPDAASGISVKEAFLNTQLPNNWRSFLKGLNSGWLSIGLHPTTISALPCMIGHTSLLMSSPRYWLSPSVFTTISAPSSIDLLKPVLNAFASPLFSLISTRWSTPACLAASEVLSVLPSLTTRISTRSIPSTFLGMSRIVSLIVPPSLKQGI